MMKCDKHGYELEFLWGEDNPPVCQGCHEDYFYCMRHDLPKLGMVDNEPFCEYCFDELANSVAHPQIGEQQCSEGVWFVADGTASEC